MKTPRNDKTAVELRLALTKRCNYRCSFCHREGQDGHAPKLAAVADVMSLLGREIAAGADDITLTGGEPFLEPALVAGILDGLSEVPAGSRPALTLVSNGSVLDQAMIARLAAYPGSLKVNISLHTANPLLYDHITGTVGMRAQVIDAIRALVAAGVTVKLNAVVMRGINSSSGAMAALLMLSRALGVKTVKFLELLRQPGDVRAEALFVGCEEIEKVLALLGFKRIQEQIRGVKLAKPLQAGFSLEVKRCSCALGCGFCRDALGRNFGPDLKQHDCFWSDQDGPRPASCGDEKKARRLP